MINASTPNRGSSAWRCQRGTILAVIMLLLLLLTVLAGAGLRTAVVELRMAGNTEYRQRAFLAAEYGIEQAMNAPDLCTAFTYSHPRIVPASGSAPAVPGSNSDSYSYRLYYDPGASGTLVSVGTGSAPQVLMAYHFVVEGTGVAPRGAADTHVQGFYVLGPPASPPTAQLPACPAGSSACGGAPVLGPHRTFWLQKDID